MNKKEVRKINGFFLSLGIIFIILSLIIPFSVLTIKVRSYNIEDYEQVPLDEEAGYLREYRAEIPLDDLQSGKLYLTFTQGLTSYGPHYVNITLEDENEDDFWNYYGDVNMLTKNRELVKVNKGGDYRLIIECNAMDLLSLKTYFINEVTFFIIPNLIGVPIILIFGIIFSIGGFLGRGPFIPIRKE